MRPTDPLPVRCAVAFKEWAGVCDALRSGRQALILRKGGIEEGPAGFVPEHSAFWLYPTTVHEAEQGLKWPSTASPADQPGRVAIDTFVVVESIQRVNDINVLLALGPLHAWTDETIHKRFAYRRPGLWVLGVRAYRRESPESIEVTPEQLGCKTWVPLEQPIPTGGLFPVRDVLQAATDRDRLAVALQSAHGATS